MIRTMDIPRLTPLAVHRPRLERWLEAYAPLPLRLLVAPAGCGKTTLLLKYAARDDREIAYCCLPPGCDGQLLRAHVSRALNARRVAKNYRELVEILRGNPAHCIELIVDGIDNADAQALAQLLRLVEDAPQNLTLIYAGRSRERIRSHHLLARGLAELCDARSLAFDAEDTALFAEACGAPTTPLELRRLVEATDGWAIAICAAVRTAAAHVEPLSKSYERWRAASSTFLYELLNESLEGVRAEDAQLFSSILSGSATPRESEMRRLAANGLFVWDDGTNALRPFRVLRPCTTAKANASFRETSSPMLVHMFGSFEAKIEGRDIPWVRRRDQQIVKYLLLKRDGRATRVELASVFWGDAEPHLATQSLRSAFSTIRKALATVVGHAAVDTYFRTNPDAQIDLTMVACDVRRFTAHIADGDAAFERGEADSAAMHYRAADKRYAGALLQREAPEPWFAVQAQLLEEHYLVALERLSEMALENGDRPAALKYAQRSNAARPNRPGVANLLARINAPRPAPATAITGEVHIVRKGRQEPTRV